MAFIMLSIYTLMSNGSATKDRVVSDDRQYLQIQTALHRIEQDFIQIYSPLYHSFVMDNRTKGRTAIPTTRRRLQYRTESFPRVSYDGNYVPIVGNEDKAQITFFSSSNRRRIQDGKESRYAWVRYSLENNSDEEKRAPFVLVRGIESINPYGGNILRSDSFTRQQLLKNVAGLEFQFWDPQTKEFVDRKRDVRGEKDLLRAVKVILTWVGEQEEEHIFEKILRPLYPFFDTEKEKNMIEKIEQEKRRRANQAARGASRDRNARRRRGSADRTDPRARNRRMGGEDEGF